MLRSGRARAGEDGVGRGSESGGKALYPPEEDTVTTCCALREVPGDFLPGGPKAQDCGCREEQGCHGDRPSGVLTSQEWEHDWGGHTAKGRFVVFS